MKGERLWWTVFATGALSVAGALVWLSAGAVRAERAELAARVRAAEATERRLAMWRLDAWLGGFLAREAARPYQDYLPEADESPLRDFSSDYVRFHFYLDGRGKWSLPGPPAPEAEPAFSRLRDVLDAEALDALVSRAERRVASRLAAGAAPPSAPEFSRRAAAGASCQTPTAKEFLATEIQPQLLAAVAEARVGPLVPLWLGPDGEPEDFAFIRRVELLDREAYQGFVGDWPRLERSLVAQIADLFPDADLEPVTDRDADVAGVTRLANLPAVLRTAARPLPPEPVWTSTRRKLALVWLAAAVAVAAVGATLRASIELGRRRQRLAAALAHELRTPLTTFRMYTEMLADGTIRDPGQRQEYLEVLNDESRRLSGLVENVLAYSGLEEQSAPRTGERLTLGELLDRVEPPLRRLARDTGHELEVDCAAPPTTPLHVDAELVSRLLVNLVDNACKYAEPDDGPVRIGAAVRGRHLVLSVSDRGPGVPRSFESKIFRPFERGARPPDDARPGVGLGLALARGLARASGGDLTLEPSPDGGTCFQVRLQAVAG